MSQPAIEPDEVRQVRTNGATVHVGVCRVMFEDDEYVVYGENEHRIGSVQAIENSYEHISRELNTFIETEHDEL